MQRSNISLVVSAPSGAGKTTIIQRLLLDYDILRFSVSTTTRPQRSGEIPGKSYYFVSKGDFRNMIDKDEFLEWAEVHDNYYGTSKKEIDRIQARGKIPIFDVDVQGAKNLKKKLANGIYIFIVPPSLRILEERLKNRKTDTENQIAVRLKNAVIELKEFVLFDYVIVNDRLDSAIDQFKAIMTAELCRRDRNTATIEKILEAYK